MALTRRAQGSLKCFSKTLKSRQSDKKTTANGQSAAKLCSVQLESTEGLLETKNFHNWVLYAIVATSVFICYFRTFFGELVNDDIFAIEHNADLLPTTPIWEVFKHDFWGKPLESSLSHKSYRPLCVLSFRANFHIHGLNAFGYRLVNVLLHGLVCLLLTFTCQTVLSCSWFFCLQCGLLFAVHPVHAEAVNSAVGRADTLACFLFLLAFLSYVNCFRSSSKRLVDQNSNKASTNVCKCLKPYWKSLVLFNMLGAAALFTKENGVTVFGFCIMYDIMVVHECHRIRSTKEVSYKIHHGLITRVLVLASVAALLLCLRVYLQNGVLPQFTPDENPASHSDSWLARFLTYNYLCFFNAWLLLFPMTQSYDWQMDSIALVQSLSDTRNLATMLFFTLLISLFIVSSVSTIINEPGERRVVLTGLLLLVIPFLPATNLFFTVGFVVAERILYIPSLGYCLLINYGFSKLAGSPVCAGNKNEASNAWMTTRRWRMVAVLYAVLLACLSWKTWQQSTIWQTRGSLFKAGVDAVPSNAKVHYNYANYLKDVDRDSEAIFHYKIAVRLSPKLSSAHNNLGTLLEDKEEAIKHFKLALRHDPQHSSAYLNLGGALRDLGNLSESEKYLRESLRLNPTSTQTIIVLTDVLTKKGLYGEAEKIFKEKTVAAPTDEMLLNNYGLFLMRHDRLDEALIIFNKLHSLAPDHATPVINKANVLISLKKYDDAEKTLTKFVKKNGDVKVAHRLATLYYKELKRPSDAENLWREVTRADPAMSEAMFSYVSLLKTKGRREEAFEVLKVFLHHPQTMEVLEEVIFLLHEMGYLNEALDVVENVLAINHKRAVLFYQKGNILKDLGLFQKSVTAFRTAIELDPNLTSVYVNLGAVYHLLGKFDEAKEQYSRALALDSSNIAARSNMEKIIKMKSMLDEVNSGL